MEPNKAVITDTESRRERKAAQRQPSDAQWNDMDKPNRSPMERASGMLWAMAKRIRTFSEMEKGRRVGARIQSIECGL